jgi:dienelactone hydrolase
MNGSPVDVLPRALVVPRFSGRSRGVVTLLACAWIASMPDGPARADETESRTSLHRVLADDALPRDHRLGPLKDLDGYFPFTPPPSAEAWSERAADVRRRILVATGLWPMPDRGPVRATVHGRVDRVDYTVEKVYLESYPGHFVTGSLYRPRNAAGRRPGVLCPHGHFARGRFHDRGHDEVLRQIAQGAERFEVGGRHPIQARCVQLARMGCVVFQYDMIGYADSQQIGIDVAHGHRKRRPTMEDPEAWGLFSAQAELRLQSVLGLQTYNSLRALDFLEGLPDVDTQRLAVTGASGGGTQTMLLSAIDPRVAVSFPAVMVSTAMQGGCTCENACCLRVGTGNVEFAALFAPKPQGMTAADDWTREMAAKGFPELQQLYQQLGAPDLVSLTPLTHFGHNYNYVSRAAMYRWMNQHLRLGRDEPIVEEDYQPLSLAEMSVWNEDHPRPPGGAEHERALLRDIAAAWDAQGEQLQPCDADTLARFREAFGEAWQTILARSYADVGSVQRDTIRQQDVDGGDLALELLTSTIHDEQLPALRLQPEGWSGNVVLWISGRGKASLFGPSGQLRDQVRRLMATGFAVVAADLLHQGEFLGSGEPLQRSRKVDNERDFAGYTLGYNPALAAQRVHDVLTLVASLNSLSQPVQQVSLLGVEGAGPWVAAAGSLAGDAVQAVAVDTGGFRFRQITDWRHVDFLPGAVKYGDLPGLLALNAPRPLWIAGEGGEIPRVVRAAYQAADAEGEIDSSDTDSPVSAAVSWLIDRQSSR